MNYNEKQLTGKKFLSSSFYLYRFYKYMSYGFPIINFCNPGVHYETPCILDLINAWKMEHIKMIKAQQVKATYTYKNTKKKITKNKHSHLVR